MKTQQSKQDIVDYLKNNADLKRLDAGVLVETMSVLVDLLVVDVIIDWDEFRRTMPSNAYLNQYVRMFVDKINTKPNPERPLTKEDLRKAFEDGRLYDANELEIRTVGIDNVFDAWYDKIFRFTKK